MVSLAVDTGNTSTKIGVFDGDTLILAGAHKDPDKALAGIFNSYQIDRAVISTVKDRDPDLEALLKAHTAIIYFDKLAANGIKNRYHTPETLGADRLAGVIGAAHLFPGVNSLVIDGGTCITYDLVDHEGNYFGGSISPGLNMRYKALNDYTAALPLMEKKEAFDSNFGSDTASSIISGVQNGIKYELTGFIESYHNPVNALNIVLTGGDGKFFDSLLKNSIFAPYIKNEPFLVLKGLNAAIPQY